MDAHRLRNNRPNWKKMFGKTYETCQWKSLRWSKTTITGYDSMCTLSFPRSAISSVRTWLICKIVVQISAVLWNLTEKKHAIQNTQV